MTPCVNDSKAICCGVAQEGLGQCVYCFVMFVGAEIIMCMFGHYDSRCKQLSIVYKGCK